MAIAGIGATLADGKDGIVLNEMSSIGTAHSSGMFKIGDIILKIDCEKTVGMTAAKAHQLLQGPAGTTVKVKYIRPPNKFEMNCTLIRETGTEHILTEQHGGWKALDLTDNRAKQEDARRRADGIYSGQEKINRVAYRAKHNDQMTAQELAAYYARRQEEDDRNVAESDKYVAGLIARDDKVADEKSKNGKDAGAEEKSWFHLPFTHSETPARKDNAGGFGWGGANNTNKKGSGGLLGIGGGGSPAKEKGEHHWPWESRPNKHDSKFMDKDIPMPWDTCGSKKEAQANR